MSEPAWVRHAIWWHVYPLGFTGADTTGVDRAQAHRLRDLVGWLDYAVELGASGLALGPIFASSSHGYDTIDHLRIDPRLGDDDDFDLLVRELRARGLRLLLDGVFNHVGREWSGPAQWLAPTVFEGHEGLVTLDHSRDDVATYVAEVMAHWLTRGADGWRLDAAYAVPPAFWARVLPRVREAHPDVWVVGEVIHGDYAGIVAAGGLDAVTQYELWKAIWSSINDRNLFELAWSLDRHNGWLDTFVPMTFVGNHDVTRIASRIEDPRHLAHALVVLLTVGGTPSIYYGDELGLTGVKEDRAGGDDAVRPAFPAGQGDPAILRLHQQLIGLRRRHPWLHSARTSQVLLTNQQLVYDVRAPDGDPGAGEGGEGGEAQGGDSPPAPFALPAGGGQRKHAGQGPAEQVVAPAKIRVLLNLSDQELRTGGGTGRVVLAGAARLDGDVIVVPPHQWAITAA